MYRVFFKSNRSLVGENLDGRYRGRLLERISCYVADTHLL